MGLLAYVICFSLISILALSNGKSVKFEICGGASDVKELHVTPCDSEPCKIARGTRLRIQANFTAEKDATKIRHEVGANLEGGLRVTFPALKRDACKSGNITCPVKTGDFQQYSVDLNILPFFPTVKGNATFKLITDQGLLMCLVAPVIVV